MELPGRQTGRGNQAFSEITILKSASRLKCGTARPDQGGLGVIPVRENNPDESADIRASAPALQNLLRLSRRAQEQLDSIRRPRGNTCSEKIVVFGPDRGTQ